jgi:predicted transcriptional regulator
MRERTKAVGFWISEAEDAKLEELARQTVRTRSGVIRVLIQQATLERGEVRTGAVPVKSKQGKHAA